MNMRFGPSSDVGPSRDVREGSGVGYILLIRRYRVTSGTTLPAMMAPSPTAAASSNKIFICQVSPLDSHQRGDQRSLEYERCSKYANTVQTSRSPPVRSTRGKGEPACTRQAGGGDGGSPPGQRRRIVLTVVRPAHRRPGPPPATHP